MAEDQAFAPRPSSVKDRLIQSLMEKFNQVGYDKRIGPMGSFTIKDETGKDNPMTSGNLLPGFPGLVHIPSNRELTPEEVRHEGTHALLGAPGAFAGQVGAMATGTTGSAGYMAPDELLAYLSQPKSAATDEDMQTIRSIANTGEGNIPYRILAERLARMRQQ